MNCCISRNSHNSFPCSFQIIRKGIIITGGTIAVALSIIIFMGLDGFIPFSFSLQQGLTVGIIASLSVSMACCVQQKVHEAIKNYKNSAAALERTKVECRSQITAAGQQVYLAKARLDATIKKYPPHSLIP